MRVNSFWISILALHTHIHKRASARRRNLTSMNTQAHACTRKQSTSHINSGLGAALKLVCSPALSSTEQQNPSREANSCSTGEQFRVFYGTWRFIVVFTRAHNWTLTLATEIHLKPSHPISLSSIVILEFLLRVNSSSGLSPSGLPSKVLNAFFPYFYLPMCATYWAHLILLDLVSVIKFGKEYKLWSLLLMLTIC
jgi:hypothetical protein